VLSKCANPVCSSTFVYLRQGKLFEVEAHFFGMPSRREYYWLCDQCAANIILCFDWEQGLVAVSAHEAPDHTRATVIPQSSQKAIFGAARVLIRPFSPLPAMRKAANEPSFAQMEDA
jgi:hypothetical protein